MIVISCVVLLAYRTEANFNYRANYWLFFFFFFYWYQCKVECGFQFLEVKIALELGYTAEKLNF